MILAQDILQRRQQRRVIARPETRKSFIVRKIEWQGKLRRCVQTYLNRALTKRGKFIIKLYRV
jgi:hypothetical protein